MTSFRGPKKARCHLADSFLIHANAVLTISSRGYMIYLKLRLLLQLEESQDWDGVIGRDFLKHRAAKLLAAAARQREREHDSAAGAG